MVSLHPKNLAVIIGTHQPKNSLEYQIFETTRKRTWGYLKTEHTPNIPLVFSDWNECIKWNSLCLLKPSVLSKIVLKCLEYQTDPPNLHTCSISGKKWWNSWNVRTKTSRSSRLQAATWATEHGPRAATRGRFLCPEHGGSSHLVPSGKLT